MLATRAVVCIINIHFFLVYFYEYFAFVYIYSLHTCLVPKKERKYQSLLELEPLQFMSYYVGAEN